MKQPAAPRYRIVTPPPQKPLFVFDGSCGFCRLCIGRWRRLTRDGVEYAPSQEVAPRQSGIPAEAFERSALLITSEGDVFSGAEAVFRALAFVPSRRLPLAIYQRVPGAARTAELVYRIVARNRPLLTRLARPFAGRSTEIERPSGSSCGGDPAARD